MGRLGGGAAVRLHVLTAVTRPENLPALEESIRRAEERLRAQIDLAKDSILVKANINAIGGLN